MNNELMDAKGDELTKEIDAIIKSGMDILEEHLDVLNIGYVVDKSIENPSILQTTNFTKDQILSIQYTVADVLFGVCTLLASLFKVRIPPLKLKKVEIEEQVIDETKFIVQKALMEVIPKYRELDVIFVPVNLEVKSVSRYSEEQQKVLNHEIKRLFGDVLQTANVSMTSYTQMMSTDDEIPPKKEKYWN